MSDKRKEMVFQGYDRVAEEYLAAFGGSSVRAEWLERLLSLTSPGDAVLDLGCGPGIPVARRLASEGRAVIGVAGSRRQVDLARANVPEGTFVQGDMTELVQAPGSVNAVSAFYSITHVPREQHERLFASIWTWLKPGGVLLASLGVQNTRDWEGEWLGTRMFFSHYDADWYRETLERLGYRIEAAEVMPQDDEAAEFLWMIGRKPEELPAGSAL